MGIFCNFIMEQTVGAYFQNWKFTLSFACFPFM